MTLLMPEFERQLRAAVRAQQVGQRRQRRPWVLLTAGTVVALGVAVLAVVLLGAGRAPQRAVAPRPAGHTPGCAEAIIGGRSDDVTVAHGTLNGHAWALRQPRRAMSNGEVDPDLLLDGHEYGFDCVPKLDFGLIATAPNGIVYGFAGLPRVSRVAAAVNALSRARPTIVNAQVRLRLGHGTFYLIALPTSACAVHSLWIDATYPASPPATIVGSGSAADLKWLLNLAHSSQTAPLVRQYDTCPPAGALVPPRPVAAAPAHALPAPPASLTPAARAAFRAGERAYNQAGCAACHALAGTGNNGSGPDLTKIGARLGPPAIASALVHPTPPMPSFAHMPGAQRRALIAFLSRLR